MSQKLGFWSVFALVSGSQIGTGILVLPTSLAPFGVYGLAGWVVSSCAAIILALLFAILCSRFPQTGGPHVYLKNIFGNAAAFFTGWTYWLISWVSTATVVISAVRYLAPLIGSYNGLLYLCLEILLLLAIMLLNLKGIALAGRVEFIFTMLKFIPLVIIPVAALYKFDSRNFVIDQTTSNLTFAQILSEVVLLTFWGFIGLESATAQAGSVINPSRTIPKAIVTGTLCVAIIYLINNIGIIGIIPKTELISSSAPYVDATQIIFGGKWHIIISLIAAIICIGTLNAWILTSGQIALGLAEDRFMPAFLAKTNKHGAPIWSIIISCMGILPLLIITANENLSAQITEIIDFSVIAFLFVYLACSIAFCKLLIIQPTQVPLYMWLIGGGAIIFCVWTIYQTPISTIIIASSFTLSGIPVYYFWYKKQH
ncbi:APC family permease [Candidatus Tisiphia endosymbiont of Nemotelus uliginosus]|uniref:APC family permease n=1 Tax=Candidatus Tisiphia endosymbiont of Nemotelus uliginosus TaxID=3077926 RepID=UPI0035C8EE9E